MGQVIKKICICCYHGCLIYDDYILFAGRAMGEIEVMEELQVNGQQEMEQETILLKEEIERMKQKLTMTTSSLEETLDR